MLVWNKCTDKIQSDYIICGKYPVSRDAFTSESNNQVTAYQASLLEKMSISVCAK